MINHNGAKYTAHKVLTTDGTTATTADGSTYTIFTVPNGYHAWVTMAFFANVGGSAHNIAATWENGVTVPFVSGKSVNAGDFLQFGSDGEGIGILMQAGDYMTATPDSGSKFTAIISFELFPREPSNFNL